MKWDALDLKILAALQEDGRMTKQRLAERVHLSPSACFERLRRLEEAGYIKGYHADLDLGRIVHTTTALVEVTLGRHELSDFARFEEVIAGVPEVLEVNSISGGIDYVMKVVAIDIEHYQAIMDRLLEADIGIAKYFTYFVTKLVKRQHAYPIHTLLDAKPDE
jgi:Lrp/AsnC family transcriptional regulator of ectoine degradation